MKMCLTVLIFRERMIGVHGTGTQMVVQAGKGRWEEDGLWKRVTRDGSPGPRSAFSRSPPEAGPQPEFRKPHLLALVCEE